MTVTAQSKGKGEKKGGVSDKSRDVMCCDVVCGVWSVDGPVFE